MHSAVAGLVGHIRGEEKVSWSEKSSRRTVGDESYSRQNEFLNDKMIVATSKMYSPGEYVFPVVYQLHGTLPTSYQPQCHSVGDLNGVHAQLSYVFSVVLDANQGVMLEAQQEIVIQEAVVPTRSLVGLETIMPACHVIESEERLSVALDKPAYHLGETMRVQCRVPFNRTRVGKPFTAVLRLFEDVSITVAPSKQGENSRLVCERSFEVAASVTTFELPLELAAVPNSTSVERSFCSSFVDRRHQLAVECSAVETKVHVAVVIL